MMQRQKPDDPESTDPPKVCETPDTNVVNSRDLLGGRREIQIQHGEEVYRLRVTRNGRLILNK